MSDFLRGHQANSMVKDALDLAQSLQTLLSSEDLIRARPDIVAMEPLLRLTAAVLKGDDQRFIAQKLGVACASLEDFRRTQENAS